MCLHFLRAHGAECVHACLCAYGDLSGTVSACVGPKLSVYSHVSTSMES
jgi:hypothetical protein